MKEEVYTVVRHEVINDKTPVLSEVEAVFKDYDRAENYCDQLNNKLKYHAEPSYRPDKIWYTVDNEEVLKKFPVLPTEYIAIKIFAFEEQPYYKIYQNVISKLDFKLMYDDVLDKPILTEDGRMLVCIVLPEVTKESIGGWENRREDAIYRAVKALEDSRLKQGLPIKAIAQRDVSIPYVNDEIAGEIW